ncbi:MAG: hypothetical protein LBQ38_11515, partial [Spirochaetaceae bacterium]|nr:hypothetical protein [Spirochaetaceae bacterium]
MKKNVVVLALLFAALPLVFAGGTKDTSASSGSAAGTAYPGTFTIGLSSWIGYAPLFVALEKGFFEKNGLTVA